MTKPIVMKKGMTMEERLNVLRAWADAYYNDSENPIVSDAKFDRAVERYNLMAKKKGIPPYSQLRAPIKDTVNGQSVPTPITPEPIGSLNKTRPTDDIPRQVLKGGTTISWKYDGLTLLLEYRAGRLVAAYTGGDTETTLNVTLAVSALSSIPQRIKLRKPTFIRGEAVVRRDVFAAIQKDKAYKDYKFHRGFVNGALRNQKLSEVNPASKLDFRAFKILGFDATYPEELATLKRLGFTPVRHKVYANTKKINKALLERMLSKYPSDYNYDGIVLMSNDSKAYLKAGFVDYKPLAAIAVKLPAADQDTQKTKCDRVEWQVSKDGKLIPIIYYPTLNFNGKDNDHATGNNSEWLRERKIGKGSPLLVVQSGDVIPNIAKSKPCKNFKLPTHCSCGRELVSVDRHLVCMAGLYNCPERRVSWLFNYVQKLGFTDVGYSTCKAMLDNAPLDRILRPTKRLMEVLSKVEGFGPNNLPSILRQFRVREHDLIDLMLASNLFLNCGRTTLEPVIRAFPDFPFTKVSVEDLRSVERIGHLTARALSNGAREFVPFLEKHKLKAKRVELPTVGTALEGTSFVFTNFRSPELESLIKSEGGRIGSSVTKKTTALFCSGVGSSKLTKASTLSITVIPSDKSMSYIKDLIEKNK